MLAWRMFEKYLGSVRPKPQNWKKLLATVRTEAGPTLVATPVERRDVDAIHEALRRLPGEVLSVWAREACDAA